MNGQLKGVIVRLREGEGDTYFDVIDGSAVFQAGGQIVAVVEVLNDEWLASVVPLIVNAVLNEHQAVIDVIDFVARGDFPRSRLGEKQRGKILSHWVTRKLYPFQIFG